MLSVLGRGTEGKALGAPRCRTFLFSLRWWLHLATPASLPDRAGVARSEVVSNQHVVFVGQCLGGAASR